MTASSSGDKIVVSSCKCKPVPLLELGEGVSEKQTNKENLKENLSSTWVATAYLLWCLQLNIKVFKKIFLNLSSK